MLFCSIERCYKNVSSSKLPTHKVIINLDQMLKNVDHTDNFNSVILTQTGGNIQEPKTTNMLDVVRIPQWRFQAQDVTDTLVIKRDFSRKTNMGDNQPHQTATLPWVAFCAEKQKRKEAA